jgi:hypothetical protein
MNNYVVRLELNIHGYEKTAIVGVAATSYDEAGTIALAGECHNTPEWDDDSKQSCWDDTMMYSVSGVTEIEDEAEYQLICKHINNLPATYGQIIKEEMDNEQ